MSGYQNQNHPPRRGGRSGRNQRPGRGGRWMGDYSLLDVRLVEPALLAFLQDENLHGYGLLDKLEGLGLGAINPSVIYRILRGYEEIGLVQSVWDEEKTQGPPRRVYTLTEEGQKALARAEESLVETSDRINKILQQIKTQKDH
ncbi:MAG: PadR family transcriptional regulator [Chloroflexota bacterium]|nr:PadR family transcriptional regulator [Chloroflexota bacterium]